MGSTSPRIGVHLAGIYIHTFVINQLRLKLPPPLAIEFCRAFTPQLAEWYKKLKKGPNGDKFDIVFVSSDRDDKSWKEYFAEMPWKALDFSDRDKKVHTLSPSMPSHTPSHTHTHTHMQLKLYV